MTEPYIPLKNSEPDELEDLQRLLLATEPLHIPLAN